MSIGDDRGVEHDAIALAAERTHGLTPAQWRTPARVLLGSIPWDRIAIDPKRTTARRFLEHL